MPTFIGTTSAETINGSAGDDVIDGRGGSDLLFGLDGADRFIHRFGSPAGPPDMNTYRGTPTLDGGAGIDAFELVGGFGEIYERFYDNGSVVHSPIAYTLGAGAGGSVVFAQNTRIHDSRDDSQSFTSNAVTLGGIEGAAFRFTEITPATQSFYVLSGNAQYRFDANDWLVINNLAGTALTGGVLFDGGTGDDFLDARAASNQITGYGGISNDRLFAGTAADQLFGEAGDDRLGGGGGNNVLNGGDGSDTADYTYAQGAVRADLSLAGASNNGFGAADTYIGIENLTGGDGDDVLVGDNGDNTLAGGAGNDSLEGRRGNDLLLGEAGDDLFLYRPGDHIQPPGGSGDGADTIDGGSGTDRLEILGDYRQGFSGSSSFYDPMTYSLTAGAGGTALLSLNQRIGIYGESSSTTSRVTTMQGVETVAFLFTSNPPPPLDSGGRFVYYFSTSDFVTIGDLTGTALTGRIDFDGAHGNDTLSAALAINLIVASGGVGNDTLITGSGNDQLTGGEGNDILTAGAGNDQLSGGDGDDTLSGRSGSNSLAGGAGVDTADYSNAVQGLNIDLNEGRARNNGFGAEDVISGVENLIGGAQNDILIGEGSANSLRGGAGADYLIGLAGNDTLEGGVGALNTLQGGLGNDLYFVANAGDTLTEFAGEGIDEVQTTVTNFTLRQHFEVLRYTGALAFTGRGSADGNTIYGGSGINTLLGLAGDDILYGGAENDVLSGGAGNDTLYGGAGNSDVADYAQAASGVFVSLDRADGIVTNDGDGGMDTLVGIENLHGSAFNDVLIGNGLGQVLSGGTGADYLIGLGGDDLMIGGTGAANTLQGGIGNDRYRTSAVGDSLIEYANEGYDTVEVSLASWVLREHFEGLVFNGVGSFSGTGNSANNGISGGGSADTLNGLDGNDYLSGLGGNDILFGGSGQDNLDGGDGDDLLQSGAGGGYLFGGAGSDTADYSRAASGVAVRLASQITSNDGDGGTNTLSSIENATGSAFNDTLFGDDGANALSGGGGVDLLLGYGGNDVLAGGAGSANTLQGGNGDDRYIVASAGDTLVEFANEGTDTVETGLATYGLRSQFERLVYTGTGAFTGRGNAEANAITGGAGGDTLTGGGGNDVLNGGLGTDTVVMTGVRADYVVQTGPGYFTVTDNVTGRDGTDSLYGIERIRFGDGSVLDLTAPVAGPALAEDALARPPFEFHAQTGDTALVLLAGWTAWDTM